MFAISVMRNGRIYHILSNLARLSCTVWFYCRKKEDLNYSLLHFNIGKFKGWNKLGTRHGRVEGRVEGWSRGGSRGGSMGGSRGGQGAAERGWDN